MAKLRQRLESLAKADSVVPLPAKEVENLRKLENTLFGLASAMGEVKDGILTYTSFEDTPVASMDSLVAAFGEGAAQCSSHAAVLRRVVDDMVVFSRVTSGTPF